MPTWKKRKRKTGIDSKAAKELLMFSLLSFVSRDMIALEHRFHPPRMWRFDYAIPALLIAIEYHGGIFAGGRHTRGVGFQGDREKMNQAAIDGWIVLEVTEEMVKSGKAHTMIEQAVEARKNSPEVRDESTG